MFENKAMPRIVDSLDCFKDITHRPAFDGKPIFLICTKMDVFKEKIENTDSFTEMFKDYTGDPKNVDECYEFLMNLFKKQTEGTKAILFAPFCQNSLDGDVTSENAAEICRIIRDELL